MLFTYRDVPTRTQVYQGWCSQWFTISPTRYSKIAPYSIWIQRCCVSLPYRLAATDMVQSPCSLFYLSLFRLLQDHGNKRDTPRSLYILFKTYLMALECSSERDLREVCVVDASGFKVGCKRAFHYISRIWPRACDIIASPSWKHTRHAFNLVLLLLYTTSFFGEGSM